MALQESAVVEVVVVVVVVKAVVVVVTTASTIHALTSLAQQHMRVVALSNALQSESPDP